MKGTSVLLLTVVVAATTTIETEAFVLPPSVPPQSVISFMTARPSSSATFRSRRSAASFPPLHAGKEEEIAALEEKLRKLKEEAASEDRETSAEVEAEEEERSYEVGKPTGAMKKLPVSVGPVYDEMISEQWKEEDDDGDAVAGGGGGRGGGRGMTTILGVIGALVFLVFFSQVPVGQEDLGKYSTVGRAPSAKIDLGDLNPVRDVKDTVYSPGDDESDI